MTRASRDAVERTLRFLADIGLETKSVAGAAGFLDGVTFDRGILLYDPDRTTSSDLLHEAGHLAVIPGRFRPLAGDDLDETFAIMGAALDGLAIDSPEMRAILQAGEAEATAWSYAAGRAIDLKGRHIIADEDFSGDGAEIRAMLSYGAHFGVHGLVHGGMCASKRDYPRLLRWLQD